MFGTAIASSNSNINIRRNNIQMPYIRVCSGKQVCHWFIRTVSQSNPVVKRLPLLRFLWFCSVTWARCEIVPTAAQGSFLSDLLFLSLSCLNLHTRTHKHTHTFLLLSMSQQTPVGQDFLIFETSRSLSDTPH